MTQKRSSELSCLIIVLDLTSDCIRCDIISFLGNSMSLFGNQFFTLPMQLRARHLVATNREHWIAFVGQCK